MAYLLSPLTTNIVFFFFGKNFITAQSGLRHMGLRYISKFSFFAGKHILLVNLAVFPRTTFPKAF